MSQILMNPKHANALSKLEAIRVLLDRGQSSAALRQLDVFFKSIRQDRTLTAEAKCTYAAALEMQGRFKEALETLAAYETDALGVIASDTKVRVIVQLALTYNYLGNHPKAIALLNQASRDTVEQDLAHVQGNVCVALARVYRSINEYKIARDYAEKALVKFRNSGEWRGLAEAYFALGAAFFFEGDYEGCIANMKQALSLINDRPAHYQLGKIYNNMAAACWFLRRPQEGIGYLEKAVEFFERTEHKTNAMDGYNNLGINLILAGEWDRAQAVLNRALALANESDSRPAIVATFLDSHAELQMLRGNLADAEALLDEAVTVAATAGNKWYEGQAIRTQCRCLLAKRDFPAALNKAQIALNLGEKIGDRHAVHESRLLIAESLLQLGQIEACQQELATVSTETKDANEDLALTGNICRIQGSLALLQSDYPHAIHYFGRSLSVYEMLGDVYRGARAHYFLGLAYAQTQRERASNHLQQAIKSFQTLGARLALQEATQALNELPRQAEGTADEFGSLLQLLTLRLSEATASRELLLHELASILREETKASLILIGEPINPQLPTIGNRVVFTYGCTEAEALRKFDSFTRLESNREQQGYLTELNLTLLRLSPSKAAPALVLLGPANAARLPLGMALDSLLRVVELGLNTTALQEKSETAQPLPATTKAQQQKLMPGFIHSSPAMTRLVDEIHKIRSSDVTVLVTGESGTGKELVARAIHANSSRRSKVFVPFNCTAVPKELSDAFLFGYRRGAFTGAVADSPGVIRAAEGGTLFLDEVGDLPLDIQPKLLRFLQEGEIQPLGEQRPVKVDVRIIAATNSDLEGMVAAGRFREDLYYRLNVIRLQVQPLRERRPEIPAIVTYYIEHYANKFGRQNIQIDPQSMDLLVVYDWPGNVRQLTNEIQRIVARAEDNLRITPDQLSPEIRGNAHTLISSHPNENKDLLLANFWENLSMIDAVDQFKRHVITSSLSKNQGNVSRTARELGMTRRGLQLMMVRYGVREA